MNVRETAKRMPQTRNADGDPAHPPVLAWFNPDAEGETLAAMNGEARNPNARVTAMEEDLEILAMSWCGPADIALLRHPPGPEHLSRLRRAGWDLPEIAGLPEIGGLAHRPLGGFRPWAWSPESICFHSHRHSYWCRLKSDFRWHHRYEPARQSGCTDSYYWSCMRSPCRHP